MKKHFSVAADVIADILQNPLLRDKDIQKEKNVVLKEIAMIYDEPRFYQWILLQQNLFEKHPCRYPTYGDVESIKKLTRNKVLDFFKEHYVSNNMVISVVGDVPNWKKEILKRFAVGRGKLTKIMPSSEPALRKNKKILRKKKILNTHLVLGFKGIPRSHADSYVLEVITGILYRGQSGKMFTEIRSKRGLAYDVGTQTISENDYGYFAIYATIDKKKCCFGEEFNDEGDCEAEKISEEELKEAQDYIGSATICWKWRIRKRSLISYCFGSRLRMQKKWKDT